MLTKEQLVGFLTVVKGSLENQLKDPLNTESLDTVLEGMREFVQKKVKIEACVSVLSRSDEFTTAAAMVSSLHKNLSLGLIAMSTGPADSDEDVLMCDLLYPMVLETLLNLGETISQLQDEPVLETPVDPAE